jgi:hypothetical protein
MEPCTLREVLVSSVIFKVMGIGREADVMVSFVSFASNIQVPVYVPKVPVPSVLNLASPTKFLRIPSGPVASTPLARRLSATHTASVRNLKRSDSFPYRR